MRSKFRPSVALFVVVALLEFAINRIALQAAVAHRGAGWYTLLDYAGLFTFYLTAAVGVALALVLGGELIQWAHRAHERLAYALAAPLFAIAIVVTFAIAAPSESLVIPLDIIGMLVVGASVVYAFGSSAVRRYYGLSLALVALALPFAVHTGASLYRGATSLDAFMDGPVAHFSNALVIAMAVAALVAPFGFASRPLATALVRLGPTALAMAAATGLAMALRNSYFGTAALIQHAIGIDISGMQASPALALYMLAGAILLWTIAQALRSPAEARVALGQGLLLVTLAGASFEWPMRYLLVAVGFAWCAVAGRTVASQEAALTVRGPVVNDVAWSTFMAELRASLARTVTALHVVSSRDDDVGQTSLLGEYQGHAWRCVVHRQWGVVVRVVISIGREPGHDMAPAFVAFGHSPRGPASPHPLPAVPATGVRRAHLSGLRVLGDIAYARSIETPLAMFAQQPGWVAVWRGASVVWQMQPGLDAGFDAPLPLSELADATQGKQIAPERAQRLADVLEQLNALADAALLPATPAGSADFASTSHDEDLSGARDAAVAPVAQPADAVGLAPSPDSEAAASSRVDDES